MSCRDVEPRNVQQEKQERSPNSKLAFHYWRGRDYYWSRWWWWQSGTEVHRETTFAFTRTVPVRGPSQTRSRKRKSYFLLCHYLCCNTNKKAPERAAEVVGALWGSFNRNCFVLSISRGFSVHAGVHRRRYIIVVVPAGRLSSFFFCALFFLTLRPDRLGKWVVWGWGMKLDHFKCNRDSLFDAKVDGRG